MATHKVGPVTCICVFIVKGMVVWLHHEDTSIYYHIYWHPASMRCNHSLQQGRNHGGDLILLSIKLEHNYLLTASYLHLSGVKHFSPRIQHTGRFRVRAQNFTIMKHLLSFTHHTPKDVFRSPAISFALTRHQNIMHVLNHVMQLQ